MAPKLPEDSWEPKNMMWVGEKPKHPIHSQIYLDQKTGESKYYDGFNWVTLASIEIKESTIVRTFNLITSEGIWYLEFADYGSHRQLSLRIDEFTFTNIDNDAIINKLKEAMEEKAGFFLEKEILDFL